jgi:uncharacterized protein
MKLLVILFVVLFGLWLWRRGREADRADRTDHAGRTPGRPTARRPPALPNEMVRCEVCGLHLPATDALTTGDASFCSPEHQRQASR